MEILKVKTGSRTEFVDITGSVRELAREKSYRDGVLHIYVPHTTGGVTINEGADPAVAQDIISVMNKIVPWDYSYSHLEGNSPAHIKSSLMGSSAQVIVEGGKIMLGTWQKIFFCEFDGPRNRKVWIKFIDDWR